MISFWEEFMAYFKKMILAMGILSMLLIDFLYPCTTFCFRNKGDWIFGRNYDWDVEYALIMVNKHQVSKTALVQPGIKAAAWVSKYGSVTINQYGRELPLGGMNEAGLVIEVMGLSNTQYPKPDDRAVVRDLQWVQYQLDTATTVAEVIASDQKIRIDNSKSQPLHFLVCDRKGQAAAIEFLDGKMRAYTGKTLPQSALANSTYDDSNTLYGLCQGNPEKPAFAKADNSLQRFILASKGVKTWDQDKKKEKPVDYAYQILEKVSVSRTLFRVVYDVKAGIIYFRTKSTPQIRSIEMKKFDFNCSSPVKILDILADLKGDVTGQFQDYSTEANLNLIKKSFQATEFLKNTPPERLSILASYPESLTCKRR
jgi:choloylglycine hydrolase